MTLEDLKEAHKQLGALYRAKDNLRHVREISETKVSQLLKGAFVVKLIEDNQMSAYTLEKIVAICVAEQIERYSLDAEKTEAELRRLGVEIPK
jgi:hypothetical protein